MTDRPARAPLDRRGGRLAMAARGALGLGLAAFVGGCGSPPGGPADSADDAGWIGADRGHGPSADELGPAVVMSDAELAAAMADERLPVGPDPEAERPPRRRVVSIELNQAPLDEVLRFLADAGGFGIVVEPAPERRVTVSLHRVEPFDALVTVAESNGLRVRYADGVAIVAP